MLRLGLAAESMSHPKRVASTFNSGIYEGIDMKKRLVQGVGLNDADYQVTKRENGKIVWICPFYQRWKSMLHRCYSENYHAKKPSYINCKVCQEWLTFSNFKSWMEKQDWKGNHLDKDIIGINSRTYSPESCIFISAELNAFTTDSARTRGKCKIGVSYEKKLRKYRSYCSNPFNGKVECLGFFEDEGKAHNAWRLRKLELSDMLLLSGLINRKIYSALIKRYSNGS